MTKLQSALLATTLAVGLALAGGSAYAADLDSSYPGVVTQTASSAYVSVFGGYALANTINGFSTSSSFNVAAPFGAGYVVGGAVGMNLMPGLRGEIELSYVSHPALGAGTPFATGNGPAYMTGSTSTVYLLGNVWYDFDTGSSITPYIGAGLGGALILPNVNLDGHPGIGFNDTLAVAGQLGAGVKFQVADNMALDLSYRARGVYGATLAGTAPSAFTKVNYIDQAVQVGLDIGF